jgi:cytochrome c oxidase assembly protein subunit 15
MPEAASQQKEKSDRSRRLVAVWLIAICTLLALMVVVGGATRLTNSGLSITEWRPVTGAVPPLSADAWQSEFDKYMKTPQYQHINRGMSLGEFKAIYWWEWGHRLLGRLIGVVFLFPMLWFLITRKLGRNLIRRLILIFALGGAQGVLGWYMVQSGLADRTEVSQYRLAAHLALAFIIIGLTLWTALDVLRPEVRPASRRLRIMAPALCGLVFLQVILGAFVAGLRAGFRFNTWPLMEGHIVPPGAGSLSPLWRNFFENPATAQFDHRMLAYVVFASALTAWLLWRHAAEKQARHALDVVLGAVSVQALLGIWTLLAVVPITLGLLHQAGALILYAATINLMHSVRPERKQISGNVQATAPDGPMRSSGSHS